MTRARKQPAPQTPAADAALDQLAAVLAPKVARLLREQRSTDDADVSAVLARAGYELDDGSE